VSRWGRASDGTAGVMSLAMNADVSTKRPRQARASPAHRRVEYALASRSAMVPGPPCSRYAPGAAAGNVRDGAPHGRRRAEDSTRS
jgi:hypothetical protein